MRYTAAVQRVLPGFSRMRNSRSNEKDIDAMRQTQVLFVCTGNAGRSQIAEALFARLIGNGAGVASAGVAPWDKVHPVAASLLKERGIDIGARRPRHVASLRDQTFDIVVTIGDQALKKTPELHGNPRRIHWDIPDPADADTAGPAAQSAAFRAAVAAIEERLEKLVALTGSGLHATKLHLATGISTICVITGNDRLAFDPAIHMPMLAAAGFKSIELGCFFGSAHFPWDQPDRVKEIAHIASDAGISINSIHAPGNTVTVADPRERRQMVDLTRAFADLAVQLGARIVVIHNGLPSGTERHAGEAALQETLAELEQHVLHMPCVYGWENEGYGLTAAEHLQWIRKFNPAAIAFVLDVGHAHIHNNMETYLRQSGLRLAGLHLHDNNGKADEHLIPGMGTIAWSDCIKGIVETGYVGPLTIEAFDFKRAMDLPAYLRDARKACDRLIELAAGV